MIGSLTPFRAHQKVKVTFYLNSHKLRAKTVKVHRGKGDYGVFYSKLIVRKGGKYAASRERSPRPPRSAATAPCASRGR